MEFSLSVKIVLGMIALELLLIVGLYIYYLLQPVEGTVYYKRSDYTEPNLAVYIIKIKRKTFGYPFSRTCRVSQEIYHELQYGDKYNSQTGEVINETY